MPFIFRMPSLDPFAKGERYEEKDHLHHSRTFAWNCDNVQIANAGCSIPGDMGILIALSLPRLVS
jgi:hypothetical protein